MNETAFITFMLGTGFGLEALQAAIKHKQGDQSYWASAGAATAWALFAFLFVIGVL